MTLRGTPFFYMGDEIGRERVSIPPDRIRDPFEKLQPGYGLCRDPERAPMGWDDGPNGGFTEGHPWLPPGPGGSRNVAGQQRDDRSILALFRELIALRREQTCLRDGEQQPLGSRNDVLAFKRALNGDEILVLLNIAPEPRKWRWQGHGRLVISTHLDRGPQPLPDAPFLLRANEGVIIAVERP